MSPLELLAVLFNALGVWLTIRRTPWCWPVGIVAVLLYAWLFREWKLYSDMLLQCVYALTQAWGWWRWTHAPQDHGRIVPTPLPRAVLHWSLVAGALLAVTLGATMHAFTDAALPWLDAALTSFSLVATVWAARRHTASWTLWIVLDTIYVGMFAYKALPLTAALYAGFVLLAIHGLRSWRGQQRRADVMA